MSFWRKLFSKSPDKEAAPVPLSLKAQYQRKLQRSLDLIQATRAAQDALAHLSTLLDASPVEPSAIQAACASLAERTLQAAALLNELCKERHPEVLACGQEMLTRLQEAAARLTLGQGEAASTVQSLRELLCPAAPSVQPSGCVEAPSLADCACLQDLLEFINACRLGEMFCLSLKSPVSKKDAVTSIPYRAFLTGMMSIPWPKARPLDMKGFISVVGVTSTTPRAEGQLQKLSFALLSRHYMNFSLCLGYHASTVEAYVADLPADNYIRFHYEGGAASVERRVRRLRLIAGILSRLGFAVTITGDLLDARRAGEDDQAMLHTMEILGRLEVFTKQMDMVLSDDDVIHGYIEDFLEKHC